MFKIYHWAANCDFQNLPTSIFLAIALLLPANIVLSEPETDNFRFQFQNLNKL